MTLTRRQWLAGAGSVSALATSGCVSTFGSKASYASQIIKPENQNTVFYWLDAIMQQVRDQRVPPPRAAYNFAMPLAAGFLAANSIVKKYNEPYGLGQGPSGADPEIAYGVAFAIAAAEVFQQPFMFERIAFKNSFPNGESKRLGIEWGRKIGLDIVKMRTHDGSEPNKVNFYLSRYERRTDSLRWRPTGPFYSAKPGPAFGSFDRGLFPGHGKIKPWTMTSSSQFRAEIFYDPASPEFAEEFDNIRRLGGADSQIRTED